MNLRVYIVFFIISISSCSPAGNNAYTEINEGLLFKLHTIGESEKHVHPGDYVSIHFQYSAQNDSVFFEGKRKFQVKGDVGPGSIIPALLKMSEGDSASLIVNSYNFFSYTLESELPDFLSTSNNFNIELKINDIQSSTEFEREKRIFMDWVSEFQASEAGLIRRYLDETNLKMSPSESGLYFISLKSGNSNKVMKGKRVWIHYTGRFLNGHFIDNSNEKANPIDYIYGTEMFLIDGLEEALGRMHEKEKALIIIPSSLAFGSYGSAGGIVPPYTTLIYELEVLKVE